jgi:DNA-binding protein HU-beta
MNKNELAVKLAEDLGVTKKMGMDFLNSFEKITTDAVASGDTVQIVDFITMKPQQSAPRQGRDPRNPKDVIPIPATVAPKLVPGKRFREKVAGAAGLDDTKLEG